MHTKHIYWASVLGILLSCSSACSNRNFEVNAYRGLAADQATYNEFVEMTVEKVQAGELSEAQKEQMGALAAQWAEAHNEATEALRLYLRLKDPISQEKYMEAAAHLREVVALVQQVMETWK